MLSHSSATGRRIAIVDPLAAGGPFGAETRALGHDPVGVLTQEFQTPYVAASFQRQDYSEILRHETLRRTVAYLAERKVGAVVPGTHAALAYADIFADALGLIGNPVPSLMARYNKRVMKEYWNAHGVPCAAHYESGELPALLSWVERQGYPVVLKPNASAASNHVYVCTDEHEVSRAFHHITHEPDVFQQRFATVLAEEYLDGTEYSIDLLHNGGEHGEIISATRYEKIQRDGHASIYRNFFSLALDDPLVVAALPQIRAANTALGVRYGISDTEYKLTSNGLRVIEVNNRLPGAGLPAMIQRSAGVNCFQESVRIFLGEYSPPPDGYRLSRHYGVCCLINDRPGRVVGHQGIDEVSRLPSFDGMRLIAEPGQDAPVTADLATAWGLVWLVHEDTDQLVRDAEAVHGLMKLSVE